MAKLSEARIKANKKYLSKFEEIKIRVPKGEKERLKHLAELEGKSLNQWILGRIE